MDPILLLILMLIFLGLPIWQTVKHNKQLRKIRDMQANLAPGAEVITGSGMHGIVVAADETTVDLTIADGVVTRWERASIARNLTEGTGADYANGQASGPADETDASEDASTPADRGLESDQK